MSCLTISNVAYANTAEQGMRNHDTVNVSIAESNFVGDVGNNSYYLDGNDLIKVSTSESIQSPGVRSQSLSNSNKTLDKEVTVSFFKASLTDAEKQLYLANRKASNSELEMHDEAMNPMGNIKAKLSLAYTVDRYSSLFHLSKAKGTYDIIVHEGVVPQSSELSWDVVGSIYQNNKFLKKGSLGFSKNYSSPTFSVKLMDDNKSMKDIVSAGATYTLKCSRGVTIDVIIPIDSNLW